MNDADAESLNDVRRAALVLRERDPSEAVRILRRVVKRGGDPATLAHGALAEILLEEFDDVDGAAHHFRALLEKAPGLPAGELGLARTLARTGKTLEAAAAYARAADGLAASLRAGQAPDAAPEETEALDETALTLLEIAVEHAELALDARQALLPLASFDDCLQWAETTRLFDDPDGGDLDDWARYLDLRALLTGLAGDRAGLESVLVRVGAAVPLPAPVVEHARSLGLEAIGDAEGAARAALAFLSGQPIADVSPISVLRAADLQRAVGNEGEALRMLEELRAAIGDAQGEAAAGLIGEIEARRAAAGAPTLVRLGLGRSRA